MPENYERRAARCECGADDAEISCWDCWRCTTCCACPTDDGNPFGEIARVSTTLRIVDVALADDRLSYVNNTPVRIWRGRAELPSGAIPVRLWIGDIEHAASPAETIPELRPTSIIASSDDGTKGRIWIGDHAAAFVLLVETAGEDLSQHGLFEVVASRVTS